MKTARERLEVGLREIDPLRARKPEAETGAEELLASILADDHPSQRGGAERRRFSGAKSGARSPWFGRRLAFAGPLAAAAVAATFVGLPGSGSDGVPTLPALARAADVAADQPPADSAARYAFMKTRSTSSSVTVASGEAWITVQPEVTEVWLASDGSGRVRTVTERAHWAGPGDRAAWEAAGRPPFMSHGWGGSSQQSDLPQRGTEVPPSASALAATMERVSLSQLPTDPNQLAELLQREAEKEANGYSIAVRTLDLAAVLLNDPQASPELRAALYRAEGLIPGVEYLGPVSDELGRRGVAVGAESSNSGAPTLYSLIFDPSTSQVLATQQLVREAPSALPEDDFPRVESTLFIESGGVDELGERP
ncbi:MAG TPA: CU044_5270 family protein [Solirubrobacterales bacterium]|jgi:hypothetical protein|nr:CU044_5270 family protein [Solirubrobacterales bacterium]